MATDEAEIGYWLGVPYWGQGLMTEAVWRLVAQCFPSALVPCANVAMWIRRCCMNVRGKV